MHIVKFEPPLIEIRSEVKAPHVLAKQLAALLNEHSDRLWKVVLSDSLGVSTLAEQQALQTQKDMERLTRQPFIQEIFKIFPGAQLGEFVNHYLDEYGLYPESIKTDSKEDASLLTENEYDDNSDE
ncbi:hypothetical protein COMNV_00318 [Commensalibacter sp. Nvir]|nr:hypothetical protein COMNV_00318 [Commensalibacter sp. Nvir]